MVWQELVLELAEPDVDPFCDICLGRGALSVSVLLPSAGAEGSAAVLAGSPCGTPRVRPVRTVRVLLEDSRSSASFLDEVRRILEWDRLPPYFTERVEDRDWVRASRESFPPILIGERLWIVPTWASAPGGHALCVRIDPGGAFGTGRHPTTRLCLEWLGRVIRGGERFLDYGCGSGILGIAALVLGAGEAFGVDQEPEALETSAANARLNGVILSLFLPEEIPPLAADLVAANILLNPLKELAPRLAASTRAGGRIALSGFQAEQAEALCDLYRQWFDLSLIRGDEGWGCLFGQKR